MTKNDVAELIKQLREPVVADGMLLRQLQCEAADALDLMFDIYLSGKQVTLFARSNESHLAAARFNKAIAKFEKA